MTSGSTSGGTPGGTPGSTSNSTSGGASGGAPGGEAGGGNAGKTGTAREPRSERRFQHLVRVLRAVLGVGALIAAVTGWVMLSGEREIAASSEALRRGDAYEAAVHARRAAGWYAPGAPHVRVAYERLIALATAAEGLGNAEIALLAWRGVRTASLETRWLVTPHAADLARANTAIARLSAAQPRPPGTRTEPASVVEREQLAALSRNEAPRTAWVAVLVAGFLGWVGGAVWALRKAARPDGSVSWSNARAGVLLCAVGVAAWLVAIWQA
ncbi:hypothetical protein [Chondromyces apiculatus]|uniref:Uncharacterized protein n=1 Tax=Chondromyces apiculatus DSM 436 TaxID=1192034 RepID=A0A017TBN0_9BACT|nr:hypothetical protein [Chondromyces apiculatus]EYF06230.1 Hypothetical protein CAP_2108 [Chondromyces apiculatus DSM 436]